MHRIRDRDNISSSYNATLPSFASRRTSEAPTYELKWNEGSQRFEATLSDSNGVLSDFDFGISGYSVDKNGNSITISSTSVNTTATTGTFTSNAGKVETTSSCVFWLTGKSGYQEFISERPTADPIKAYIKVKTENIGYGELTKTDESSGVKLSGAVYGIYSDSGCTNRVQTMTKIHIYKVDKESGKAAAQGDASLEGAVYGLYARNDIVHPDGATGVVFKAGDLVATLTTDKNGEAEVNNLYLGNYYVKEITPSEGYLLDEEEHDVVCDYEGDLVADVSRSTTSAEQVIKQPFQLIKVSDNGDDTEAGLLAGAEFTAYLKSSLPVKADGSYDFDKATPVVIGENGATTITSDDKGHAVSIAIPYGTYVVVESKTPHNMKTIKPFEVKISENHPDKPQTWRVFLDREFTAKLRVIKKDSDTKQTVLVPNAEFKIFNLDKNEYVTQYTTYPSKVKHTSFFTDEDGDLILPEALKIGNYRIEEVKAPFGYVVNDNYINISVDTDTAFETDGDTNDAIITVEYSDAPAVGELTVEKKGEVLDGFKGGLLASSYEKEFVYKEGSLAGAKFKVYAAEDIYTADNQKDAGGNRIKYYSKGDLVTTLTTGKDGKATAKNLPLGQYRVVEASAPYGYVLNPNEQKVTFTYVDDKTPVIKESLTFSDDRQKLDMSVTKLDAEDNTPIAGAVFGLYADEDIKNDDGRVIIEKGTLLEKATSDENGKIAFVKDYPFAKYVARELVKPAGYVTNGIRGNLNLHHRNDGFFRTGSSIIKPFQ